MSQTAPEVRLPEWTRSIRFRLTILYSAVLFVVAALLLTALYVGLSWKLDDRPVTQRLEFTQAIRAPDGRLIPVERFVLADAEAFEQTVNRSTLDQLRNYSLAGLGILFALSIGVGWVISGRVLAPIESITSIARRIQATDLSKRIDLSGPDDELKDLADTFDEMLERLDSAFAAQREFIADASHELRNPLAIIQTNVDLAVASAHNVAGDERARAEAAIRRAIDRMSRLVEDLLLLARQDAPAAAAAECDLSALADEVSEDFEVAASARKIGLRKRLGQTAAVRGDAEALKRVLANLLDNAVRLAPENSVITIATGARDDWVWATVTDEGPGIAADDRPRIFDRFWRSDPGRARRAGGTGLGLAIVHRVVEAHGGSVSLSSEEGVGTTFAVWLPAAGREPRGEPPREVPSR